MNKRIIIPTDFTVESLNIVKLMLNEEKDKNKLDIILLHGISLTESITDLLYFSKANTVRSLSNASFDEGCAIIKNKYESRINSIRVDLFFGTNQNAFNNYVEGLRVEKAFLPIKYKFQFSNDKSFNLFDFIYNSPLEINKFDWISEHGISPKGELSNVFFNSISRS